MRITQIKEVCLYVQDLYRTRDFYHDILGLDVISLVEGRHVFFKAGNSVLLCFIAKATSQETVLPPHYASGRQHLAFEVTMPAYKETKSELEARGVMITAVRDWKKGALESFYFSDPDGHVLEVVPEGLWD